MAKKDKDPVLQSFNNPERTQHDTYVEQFTALTNGMNQGDQPREIVMKQVDHLLDKHAVDYPEIVIGYQLGRLATEVEGMLV